MEGILKFSVFQDLNIPLANTQLQTAVDCIRLRKETEHFLFYCTFVEELRLKIAFWLKHVAISCK
jgi:hypothetical protein